MPNPGGQTCQGGGMIYDVPLFLFLLTEDFLSKILMKDPGILNFLRKRHLDFIWGDREGRG